MDEVQAEKKLRRMRWANRLLIIGCAFSMATPPATAGFSISVGPRVAALIKQVCPDRPASPTSRKELESSLACDEKIIEILKENNRQFAGSMLYVEYNSALLRHAEAAEKLGRYRLARRDLSILVTARRGGFNTSAMTLSHRILNGGFRAREKAILNLSFARELRESIRIWENSQIEGPIGLANVRQERGLVALYERDFANAAWEAKIFAAEMAPPLTNETFVALQSSFLNYTSEAIAISAARAIAARSSPRLAKLVDERHAVITEYAAMRNTDVKTSLTSKQISQKEDQAYARNDEILAIFHSEFPEYFNLIDTKPVEIVAIQQALAEHEAVLMIVPSARGTHIMAITSGQIRWVRSALTAIEVDRAVRRLRWDVGANVDILPAENVKWSSEGKGAYPFDRKTAYRLHRELIEPVASTIVGKRHLFIAAAGSLSNLPFGILVTDVPRGADGNPASLRSTSWFADAHALVQIPSMKSLVIQRSAETDRARAPSEKVSFLGFGDPTLLGTSVDRGSGGSRVRNRAGTISTARLFTSDRPTGGLADINALAALARLPGTARELDAMRQSFGTQPDSIFTQERDTEAQLKAVDLSKARVLVFATHGLIGGELTTGSESGLVFTPPKEASNEDDGFLTASEVASLKLDADWVILSACNTANVEELVQSSQFSSLTKAFFFAGAKTLLVSHWPVRDDIAALITVRAVQIARDQPRLSRAEALQIAMREIRNDARSDGPNDTWAHPNAWAPFTLVGETGGIAQ